MKKPEEIKKGLKYCHTRSYCSDECPFYSDERCVSAGDALAYIRQLEVQVAKPIITGETSDGYHTFNELYHHRAVLFSVIVKAFPDKTWKSRLHHDGSMYDGMFIVGIETPDGQATYHYDLDPYWDMFACKEVEHAPDWDGHTAAQAIERIGKLEPVKDGTWKKSNAGGFICCSNCNNLHATNWLNYGQWNYCPNCGAKMKE